MLVMTNDVLTNTGAHNEPSFVLSLLFVVFFFFFIVEDFKVDDQ